MKKRLFLLMIPTLMLVSCGEEGDGTNGENTDGTELSTEGMVELDLAEHGLPLMLMVPVVSSPISGEPIPPAVEAFPDDFIWHIRIGDRYHLIIEDMGESENHIAGVKSEHESVTNIWDVNYLVDEADALFWVQTLPENSGLTDGDGKLKGFYHLEVYKNINGVSYEIYTGEQDENGSVWGEKLMASAKSIKSNAPA